MIKQRHVRDQTRAQIILKPPSTQTPSGKLHQFLLRNQGRRCAFLKRPRSLPSLRLASPRPPEDTNLLLLRLLLGLQWQSDGWARNALPPGGQLIFQLERPEKKIRNAAARRPDLFFCLCGCPWASDFLSKRSRTPQSLPTICGFPLVSDFLSKSDQTQSAASL